MWANIEEYEFCYRQATFPLWTRYHINKLEFRLLLCLSWYLKHKNKTIVSKELFFNTCTFNKKERKRMEGYLQGLVKNGLVGGFEYISLPGSLSIGISDLGVSVIKDFNQHYEAIRGKYKISPYRLIEDGDKDSRVISYSEEPKPKYKQYDTDLAIFRVAI